MKWMKTFESMSDESGFIEIDLSETPILLNKYGRCNFTYEELKKISNIVAFEKYDINVWDKQNFKNTTSWQNDTDIQTDEINICPSERRGSHKNFYIIKLNDDWFWMRVEVYTLGQLNMGEVMDPETIFYICDEMSGLLNCIKFFLKDD